MIIPRSLVMVALLAVSQFSNAGRELITVTSSTTPESNITLRFSGQLGGSEVIIDKVDTVVANHRIAVTVSRRTTLDFSLTALYEGTVKIGKLESGWYDVDLYVRDPTGARPPNDYAPAKLAASTSFLVVAAPLGAMPTAVPTVSSFAVSVLIAIVLGIGGINLGRRAR